MSRCDDCKYAVHDYAEYYGGARQYFIADCERGGDMEAEDCEMWEERKDE